MIMENPNVTLDRNYLFLPTIRKIIEDLQAMMRKIKNRGLKYSSWCDTLDSRHVVQTTLNKGPAYEPMPNSFDDVNIPWFTLWEYSWLIANSGILNKKDQEILDLGGGSSVLSAYLADKGNHVTVIDRRGPMIENAIKNAKMLGYSLEGVDADLVDIKSLLRGRTFDHIISVSVLFLCGREARSAVLSTLKDITRKGSKVSISFDYLNPNPKRYVDNPEKYFYAPGFRIVPKNSHFVDNEKRYHFFFPDPSKGYYTCGALFMEKI